MLVSESTLPAIQSDHQHWLREIERWDSCLEGWEGEQSLLARELARLQESIEKHGSELKRHVKSLKALKTEIAASERELILHKGADVDRGLAEAHSKLEVHHSAERDLHERLKQMQHTLMERLDLCDE
jgi:chromosome segregation ATPase